MKVTHLLGAAGLAGAVAVPAPAPDLDLDMLNAIFAAPTPATLGPEPDVYSSTVASYNPTTASAVVQETVTPDSTETSARKRDDPAAAKCASNHWDCCPLPTGTLPIPSPDTADAFTALPTYASLANGASTPARYTKAFTNLQGSTQQAGYRGVYTLDSYDPSLCAAKCDADNYCQGFNIYIERDPVIRPDYDVCKNPGATANIKCTIYGYPISSNTATNVGQYQGDFHVVIAASNGYNKPYTAPTLPNFNAPVGPLAGAIEDSHYYLYELYNDGPFDPASCAKGCQANTAYNKAHPKADGTYTACNLFNAYILYRDDNPQGTVCSYYSADIPDPASKATNVGQYQGSVHVTVGNSYTYTLTKQDKGCAAPSTCQNAGTCNTGWAIYNDQGYQAACGPDPQGAKVCFQHGFCGSDCSSTSDCGCDEVCVASTCCGRSVCLKKSSVCPNQAAQTRRALMAGKKLAMKPRDDSCTSLSCPNGQ
ncbi:hypothetical protein SLS56_006662 [Neofusicoccum ribis]|uniref:Uncharacterized protein n=1 Tax=Neofusicoccum ribis TaxID=45134 RepID=A0ABR3SRT0_9PEZI